MAKHFPKHSVKIVAPTGISKIADRVIGARMKCIARFNKNSHGDTSSNENHAHFTGVISSMWDVQRPCWTRNDGKPDEEKKTLEPEGPTGIPSNSNGNGNEHLELEDTDSDVENPKSVKAGCNALIIANLPRASVQLDEKLLKEEFMFVVQAFVDDLQQVREPINFIWRSYHGGEIDLLVACVVTTTAIDLVRQAERSFESVLKRPKKYPAIEYLTGAPSYSLPGAHA